MVDRKTYAVEDAFSRIKKRKKWPLQRPLSLVDTKHYCNIITAIQKTIEIQKVIDNIYPRVENVTRGIEL